MRNLITKVEKLFETDRLVESTERTLYHGTLAEYLPEIEKHGLIPTVGSFVSNFYDPSGDEGYDAEEDALDPLIFAAQKSDLQRCVNAIGHRLREKNIPWTPENIIKYGAIVAVKNRWGDFHHRNHDTSRGAAWDVHPIQVEPGDYYSMEEQIPHYVLTGKRLRDLLRRERIEGFYSPPPIQETVNPDVNPDEFPWSMPQEFRDLILSWPEKSKSPYSSSYYSTTEKTWDHTPLDSYRISNHWNFKSKRTGNKINCPMVGQHYKRSWTLAKWDGEIYHAIKSIKTPRIWQISPEEAEHFSEKDYHDWKNARRVQGIRETDMRKWISLCESPTEQLYIRFGKIPENERSKIHAAPNWIAGMTHHSRDFEKGVSVYWTHFQPLTKQWVLDDVGNHASAVELIAQADHGLPIYIVKGTEQDEQGIDGEPLLHNVEIVGQVKSIRDILVPGCYDGHEMERVMVFRGDTTMIYPDGTTKEFPDDYMTQDHLDEAVCSFASLNGIEVTYKGQPALFFMGCDPEKPENPLAEKMLSDLLGRDFGRKLYGNSMIIKNYKKSIEHV